MKGPPADAVRAARHSKDDLDMAEAGPRAAARRAARALVPGLRRALDRPVAQLLTGLLTVFALFGDDVSATCPRAVVTPLSHRCAFWPSREKGAPTSSSL